MNPGQEGHFQGTQYPGFNPASYPGSSQGYPGGQQGYPGGQQGYPGGQQGYSGGQQGYPGGQQGYPGGGEQGHPGGQQGYPPPPGFVVPPPGAAMYGSSSDFGKEPIVGGDDDAFEFTDKTIRRGFIRKVYSILMCQLLVTSSVIALFTYHEPTKKFVQTHTEVFWIAFAATMITMIVMACCANVRRKAPMNFIFLGMFTAAEAVVLGTMASMFNAEEVLMAAGLTAAICFALTLFAFQTKWDFTIIGGGLFVALIVLMIFGIVAIFVPGKTISMIYASVGALLFSLYLIYDTQLMMGGKHKFSISPEEYIFAALNLYLDVVNIFIYILSIIGLARSD